MVNLVEEVYAKYYSSAKCSGAFCFCVTMCWIIVLFPFFITFTTHSFWTKITEGYEMPIITYDKQYMITVMTTTSVLFNSNIPEIQRERENNLNNPSVQVSSINNETDRPQKFNAQIILNEFDTNITKVEILLFFKYQLTDYINLAMRGFALVEFLPLKGVSKGQAFGEIRFNQRHPLFSGSVQRIKYNYPAFKTGGGDLLIDTYDILKESHQRNETIEFVYKSVMSPGEGLSKQVIDIELTVPKYQPIQYIPTLLETLKFAWTQYFSIFIVFFYIGRYWMRYFYSNNIFITSQRNDLPRLEINKNKYKTD